MTITVPTTLGPSWIPRLGGLLAVFTGALQLVPDTAPGMTVIKPWTPFFNAVAVGLVGFSARQQGVSTEQALAAKQGLPMPPPPPVPAPLPPVPPAPKA